MKRFLLIFVVIYLVRCKDEPEEEKWNYASNGRDWGEKFRLCGYPGQSPRKINSEESEELEELRYFFPKYRTITEGKLQLENQDNLLVLNFSEHNNSMADLILSRYAPFLKNTSKNEEAEIIYANCTSINFKMPSEHFIEEKRYDMELQIGCSSKTFKGVVSVLVEKSTTQSTFFDNFKSFLETKDLPITVKITQFDDLFDALSIVDGVYTYDAYQSYPPCKDSYSYYVINKPISITQQYLDFFYGLLNKTQTPKGNVREIDESLQSEDLFKFSTPK